jgi:hypothetical protein
MAEAGLKPSSSACPGGGQVWCFCQMCSACLPACLSVQVEGIPTFVVVDGESGEAITLDGRGKVGSDAACKDFPWRAGATSGGSNEVADDDASDSDSDDDDDDDDNE